MSVPQECFSDQYMNFNFSQAHFNMHSSNLEAVIMSLPFMRQTRLPLKTNKPSYYYDTADGVAEQSCHVDC